jgi:outer membrane protein OmpA-like peptidoglycan-associated protein
MHSRLHPSIWIGALWLGLAWSIASADTPSFPSTASEIEQALAAPRYRSFDRGPERIADDPAELQNLPKTAALIHFDSDSNRIRPDAYPLLNEYVKALKGGLSDAVLVIAGHTDSIGSEVYNQNLSRRRAQAVKDYLVHQGITADQLTVRGFGKTQPIASNETKDGRAQNRRVEFIRVGSRSTTTD